MENNHEINDKNYVNISKNNSFIVLNQNNSQNNQNNNQNDQNNLNNSNQNGKNLIINYLPKDIDEILLLVSYINHNSSYFFLFLFNSSYFLFFLYL